MLSGGWRERNVSDRRRAWNLLIPLILLSIMLNVRGSCVCLFSDLRWWWWPDVSLGSCPHTLHSPVFPPPESWTWKKQRRTGWRSVTWFTQTFWKAVSSLVDWSGFHWGPVLPFLDVLVGHISQTRFEHRHTMPRRLLTDVTWSRNTATHRETVRVFKPPHRTRATLYSNKKSYCKTL